MIYNPDKWVIVKITDKEDKTHYRVFGSWYGGYLGSDSWRMNSGINGASREDHVYSFYGNSGSEYRCNTKTYGTSGYGGSVLNQMIEQHKEADATITVMPEHTNWLTQDWGNVK